MCSGVAIGVKLNRGNVCSGVVAMCVTELWQCV